MASDDGYQPCRDLQQLEPIPNSHLFLLSFIRPSQNSNRRGEEGRGFGRPATMYNSSSTAMHGKHTKTESETSISLSSPPRSPPRQPYYVQSPLEYGDRTAPSYNSTPARSPPRETRHHRIGQHSWESSTSHPLSPMNTLKTGRRRDDMEWRDRSAIEEESLLHNRLGEEGKKIPRRVYVLGFIGIFLLLLALFSLILWSASHKQSPEVAVNSIRIEEFNVQAGTDSSGVPTDLVTLNSTVKLTYRNSGSFFGVHVTSTPLLLKHYLLTIASGNVDYFYQSRKSGRKMEVVVASDMLPIYGGGAGLSSRPKSPAVNLTLSFTVRSRAFVLGKLVKPKFYNRVLCDVVLDPTKLNTTVSLNDSCKYS